MRVCCCLQNRAQSTLLSAERRFLHCDPHLVSGGHNILAHVLRVLAVLLLLLLSAQSEVQGLCLPRLPSALMPII